MENETKSPPTKAGLTVGMRFRKIGPKNLFCNNNYQYGLQIETYLNKLTKSGGMVASGEFDPDKTIQVVDLLDQAPDYIGVRATARTGACAGGSSRYLISLGLFRECFEKVS